MSVAVFLAEMKMTGDVAELVVLLHRPAELEAVDPAHHHVEQDQVGPVDVQGGDQPQPVRRLRDLIALELSAIFSISRVSRSSSTMMIFFRAAMDSPTCGLQRRFHSPARRRGRCGRFPATPRPCAPPLPAAPPRRGRAGSLPRTPKIDSSRESPPPSRRSTTFARRATMSSYFSETALRLRRPRRPLRSTGTARFLRSPPPPLPAARLRAAGRGPVARLDRAASSSAARADRTRPHIRAPEP